MRFSACGALSDDWAKGGYVEVLFTCGECGFGSLGSRSHSNEATINHLPTIKTLQTTKITKLNLLSLLPLAFNRGCTISESKNKSMFSRPPGNDRPINDLVL